MAESRSPGGDRAGFLVARLCSGCGAQQSGEASEAHFGGCPNIGKIFARDEIEVVPAVWREVAEELANAIGAYRHAQPGGPSSVLRLDAALARFDALAAGTEGEG